MIAQSILDQKWLDVPNTLGILVDASVRTKEAHSGDAADTLGHPLILVSVFVVHHLLGIDVTLEIVRYQIVVAVIANGRHQGTKIIGLSELATLDGLKDFGQV